MITEDEKSMRLQRTAAALAIVALGFILWGIHGKGMVPVVLGMSVGQGLGTLSFALYLYELWYDFRRRLARARAMVAAGERSSGSPASDATESAEDEREATS